VGTGAELEAAAKRAEEYLANLQRDPGIRGDSEVVHRLDEYLCGLRLAKKNHLAVVEWVVE
jgi:hypothetical protein